MNFEQYAAKGNEMIYHLAVDLDIPRDQAGRILRASLHGLRNRLSLQENFNLLAQLPMMLKAVYVDGWKPIPHINRSHHLRDFLNEIRAFDVQTANRDLGNDDQTKYLIKGVFRILAQYFSEGEMKDVLSTLPLEIKEFISSVLDENQIF